MANVALYLLGTYPFTLTLNHVIFSAQEIKEPFFVFAEVITGM
jgi:hypothetical protein